MLRVYCRRAQKLIKKFFREEVSARSRVLCKARNLFRASIDGTHARADFRFPIKSPFIYRLWLRIRVHAPRFRAKADSQCCWGKHHKARSNSFPSSITLRCTTAHALWSIKEFISYPVKLTNCTPYVYYLFWWNSWWNIRTFSWCSI